MNVNPVFADISSNNPRFNATEYRDAGHIMVAIKASEGTSYVNPNHRGWCYAAGMHHIAIVHYHFARPDLGTDPQMEADHFLSVALRLAGGRDYLCLDMERSLPSGFKRDPAWSQAFDEYVQQHSRFHTVLYSSRSWLQESDRWLVGDKKRVWDADWSHERDYSPPGYRLFARQLSDGHIGPGPHSIAGVGVCDTNFMAADVFGAVRHELP